MTKLQEFKGQFMWPQKGSIPPAGTEVLPQVKINGRISLNQNGYVGVARVADNIDKMLRYPDPRIKADDKLVRVFLPPEEIVVMGKTPASWKIGLLLLPLYFVSLHWNAWSAVKWTFNGQDDDIDDGENPYGTWEKGMNHLGGLGGVDAAWAWDELKREFPKKVGHNTRNLLHAWVRDYTKRAMKLWSLATIILLWLGVLGWVV